MPLIIFWETKAEDFFGGNIIFLYMQLQSNAPKVQLSVAVSCLLGRAVSFTLKWPHVVMTVMLHTVKVFYPSSMDGPLPRVKPYVCALAHTHLHECVHLCVGMSC